MGIYPVTGQSLQMVQLPNTFDFRLGTSSPMFKKKKKHSLAN